MQTITDSEFAQEIEALKTQRRISVNRPILDPDLPDLAAVRAGGGSGLIGPSPLSPGGVVGSPGVGISPYSGGGGVGAGTSSVSANTGTIERSSSAKSFLSSKASKSLSSRRGGVGLSDDGPIVGERTGSLRGNEKAGAAYNPTDAPGAAVEREGFTARRRGKGALEDGITELPSRRPAVAPIYNPPDTTLDFEEGDAAGSRQLDPSHLFWVPASMHPEISPSDFRKFLHDAASRAVQGGAGEDAEEGGAGGGAGMTGSSEAGDEDVHPALQGIVRRTSKTVGPIARGAPSSSGQLRADLISRSTSLSRRASTLRRQYRPESDTDISENEESGIKLQRPPVQRKMSSGPTSPLSRSASKKDFEGPTLTLEDLQKLEQLAEEASRNQDPQALRSAISRTMSMSSTSSALDRVDDVHNEAEDADAPIILPRPGQILRRAARTKIRKSSFGDPSQRPSRRRTDTGSSTSSPADDPLLLNIDDAGSSEKRDSASTSSQVSTEGMQRRQSAQSDTSANDVEEQLGGPNERPLSDEATESILEAYSRDSYMSDAADGSQRTSITSITDSIGTSQQQQQQQQKHDPLQTPTQSRISGNRAEGYFDAPSEPDGAVKGEQPMLRVQTENLIEQPATSPERETPFTASPVPVVDSIIPHPSANQIIPIPISHVPEPAAFEKTRPAPRPPVSSTQTAPSVPPVSQAQPLAYDQQPATSQQGSLAQPMRRPRSPPPAPKHKEKKGFASWFGISKDDEDKPIKADRKREKGRVEEEASSSFLGSLFGKRKGAEEPMPPQRWTPVQTTAGSLLDRSAGGARLINNYYRYPIHVERAVYRLSHIKLANPRRPLYEQVLISNLMFWYLSIINRSANGSYGTGQTQLVQGGGHAPGTTPPVEIEPEEQPASKLGKAKKGSLVKPNRAPPGRGSAEIPIATAGYGQQHRQINSEMALQHTNPQTTPTLASQYGLQNAFHQPSSAPGFTPGQVVDPNLLHGHGAGYGANGDGQEMASGLPNGTYDQSETGRQEQRWSGGSSGSDPSTSPEARYAGRTNEQQWQANGRHPADSSARGGERQRRAVSPVESEHAWLGANNSSRGGGGGFSTFGYGDDAPLHESDHRRNQSEPNGEDMDDSDYRMQRLRSSDPGVQRGAPPSSVSGATPGMVTVTPPEAGPQRSPDEQAAVRTGYRSVSDSSSVGGTPMNGKGLHVDDGYAFPISVSDPASLSLAAMNAPKAGPIVTSGLTTKQQQAAGKAAVAAAVAAGRRPPSPQPPLSSTTASSAMLDAALLARQSRRSR